MIRLIASDMDGTLVENVNSPLPEGLIELIETMYGRGIRFAVATGRQYSNVEALFRPVRDKIYFIGMRSWIVRRLLPVTSMN